MLLENFNKFIKYYGPGRKLKLAGFSVLSLVAGMLEFAGIALIYPFILMIISPDVVTKSALYAKFVKLTSFGDATSNALLIGLLVLFIFIFKNVFIIFSLAMQNKFLTNWKKDLVKRFMEYYLFAPYNDILKTSPSDKIYTISVLCSQAIDLFAVRVLNLFTNSIIVAMIVSLLLWKFPLAAISTIIFVSACLVIQNKYFKKRTTELAIKLTREGHAHNEILFANLYNIKELKILSAEQYFYNQYADAAAKMNNLNYQYNLFNSMPPYIIEILVVVSVMILCGIISLQNLNNSATMIASFAVVVAAIFRIF